LDEAKVAFDSKDYKTALELAMRSEGELEKVGLQQDMAAKAINTAETKFSEAKDMGVFSSKAKSLLDTAKQNIKKGDYVKALENAIQSGDELHKVREEFGTAEETLEQLNNQIDTSTEIGVEISIARKLFTDAESAMKGHDYKTAHEIAQEGLIEARRLSYAKLTSKISNIYALIDLANKVNLDVSKLGSFIAEAKTFMETGKFKVSNEKIELCLNDVNEKLQTHILDFITNSETSITHAKEVGVDVTESEKFILDSRNAMEAGKYEDALNLAKKSMSGIVELKSGLEREFITIMNSADSLISSAKKFGINVKEAENLFSQARELKAKDHKGAVKLINESIKFVQDKMDDFRPRLEAEIVADRVVVGEWVETELSIKNTGKTLGTDVSAKMIGDIEYEGDTTTDKLKGGGDEIKLPLKIRFSDVLGDRPIILELTSHRLMDNQTFVDKSTTNIYVGDSTVKDAIVKKAFERLKAPEEMKCDICMGKVKKGLDIIKCSCGKNYHDLCATRFGKCAACGNPFAEELDKDAERDVLGGLEESGPMKPTKPEQPEVVEPEPEQPETDVQPKPAGVEDQKVEKDTPAQVATQKPLKPDTQPKAEKKKPEKTKGKKKKNDKKDKKKRLRLRI
jgi:hypothetical protein